MQRQEAVVFMESAKAFSQSQRANITASFLLLTQANIMNQSSQPTFCTINMRQVILAKKKRLAKTNVAVVTASTAGPRFGISPVNKVPFVDIVSWICVT